METHDTRKIQIEFLYLDLNVCSRCRETEANLDAAIHDVTALLREAGVEVVLSKTKVASEQQARALRFLSSPTIRVNGQDIAPEPRESQCSSCGSICDGPVDCRVWEFRGQQYTEAPKAMIVDAILRAVYAGQPASTPQPFADVPDNLKRFFALSSARNCSAGCCEEKKP